MANNGGNPAMAAAAPAVPDAAIDYGSIGELLAHLNVNLDPADVFDVHAKLPHWLHHAKENEFVTVDAHTAPDPSFAAAATFHQSLTGPGFSHGNAVPAVFVNVMPTIPLHDAHRIEEMALHNDVLPVAVDITILNPADLKSKVSAFKSVKKLLNDINKTRQVAESQLVDLANEAATKHQRAAETADVYQRTKDAYQALPVEKRGVSEEHLDMVTAAVGHFVARDLANVAELARAAMADQVESLLKTAADLEATIHGPTFMGARDD